MSEPPTILSATTDRLYVAAQNAFLSWCRARRVRFPASHEAVADYLDDVHAGRGPTAVRVHLSALARLYREMDHPLDTKANVIQSVLRLARGKAPEVRPRIVNRAIQRAKYKTRKAAEGVCMITIPSPERSAPLVEPGTAPKPNASNGPRMSSCDYRTDWPDSGSDPS